MNRAITASALLLTALFCTTFVTQAQNSNSVTVQAPTAAHIIMLRPSSCPVGFSAGHSAGLTELRASDAKPGVISQSLNVQMSNSGDRDIVSAQITVHGLSPDARLTLAVGSSDRENGSIAKQMALQLPVVAHNKAAADLRVYGFTSVQRIDLDSVTYADGSTWNASPQRRCSIVPNRLMLVANAGTQP